MATHIHRSFAGGMNLLTDDTKISDNEYGYGQNVRTRYDVIEGVQRPVNQDLENLVPGKKQAIFSVGEILAVVSGGKLYYKLSEESFWRRVGGVQLDPDVNRVYVQSIPRSTLNYLRIADTANEDPEVTFTRVVETPQGIVVQDGINLGYIVYQDGGVLKVVRCTEVNYTRAGQEAYIPIGTLMTFTAAKLFLIADGNKIYHSVSGRPADFAVAIESNGTPQIAVENADLVRHAVDFNEIRAILDMNNSGVLVGTDYAVYLVEFDDNKTLFGEPAFRNTKLFTAGIVNQFSMVDLLGDLGFIDYEGIKSFNSVRQISNEGRNSIFSQKISRLMESVVQNRDSSCAYLWDNYALFSVDLIGGDHGIVVYDTLNQSYMGVDKLTIDDPEIEGGKIRIGKVKQFAQTISKDKDELYCITVDDQIYKLYDSSEYESSQIILKSIVPQMETSQGTIIDLSKEHKTKFVRMLVDASDITSGDQNKITVGDSVDGGNDVRKEMGAPYRVSSKMTFTLPSTHSGTKISRYIEFSGPLKIIEIQTETEEMIKEISNVQSRQCQYSIN